MNLFNTYYSLFKFKKFFKSNKYKEHGKFFNVNNLKILLNLKALFLNKYLIKYLDISKTNNWFVNLLDKSHPITYYRNTKNNLYTHYFNDILFTPWMVYICTSLIGLLGIFFLFMEELVLSEIIKIELPQFNFLHVVLLYSFLEVCYLHNDLFDLLYMENATIKGIRYIYGWEHRYKVWKPMSKLTNINFEQHIEDHPQYNPLNTMENPLWPNENWPDWGYEDNTFVPNWWEMHDMGDMHQFHVIQIFMALTFSIFLMSFILWNDIYSIDLIYFLLNSKYNIIYLIFIVLFIYLGISHILIRNTIIRFDIRIFRHVIQRMFYRPYWYHGKWENLSLGQERGLYNYNLNYWNRFGTYCAMSDYIKFNLIQRNGEFEIIRHIFSIYLYFIFGFLLSYINFCTNGVYYLYLSLLYFGKIIIIILFCYGIFGWVYEIIIESVYLGKYNVKIRATLVCGFFLFLISEIMLFAGLFWAYFDRIFNLTEFTDHLSIPIGMERVRLLELPLLGLLVLIVSGFFCNKSYYSLKIGNYYNTIKSSFFSILFGIIFLLIQFTEYVELRYAINDSVFSSLFYMLTGFHGMHVFIGLLLLIINYMRIQYGNFSKERNTGAIISLFYWHFVDIIWIFLIFALYFMNHGIIFTTTGLVELFGAGGKLVFVTLDNSLINYDYDYLLQLINVNIKSVLSLITYYI